MHERSDIQREDDVDSTLPLDDRPNVEAYSLKPFSPQRDSPALDFSVDFYGAFPTMTLKVLIRFAQRALLLCRAASIIRRKGRVATLPVNVDIILFILLQPQANASTRLFVCDNTIRKALLSSGS